MFQLEPRDGVLHAVKCCRARAAILFHAGSVKAIEQLKVAEARASNAAAKSIGGKAGSIFCTGRHDRRAVGKLRTKRDQGFDLQAKLWVANRDADDLRAIHLCFLHPDRNKARQRLLWNVVLQRSDGYKPD